MWRIKSSDWILNIENRRAQRNKMILIDFHFDLCKRVIEIFLHFENAQRLIIYQLMKGSFCVELRHFKLSFFVNHNSLFECRKLHAEIDLNQNARTFYEFESKTVLRDVINIEQRNIIIALKKLIYKRHDMHVAIQTNNINEYDKFEIDIILERLTCSFESLLIFFKVQFHAFISFILSDFLIGRINAKEVLYTLKSNYNQSWTTFDIKSAFIFKAIETLNSKKKYYFKNKRRLQTIKWNKNLIMNIQNDQYKALVQKILMKSIKLRAFALNNEKAINFNIENRSHLRKRDGIRRLLYERSMFDSDRMMTKNDMKYEFKNRQVILSQVINVYKIVKLIRQRLFKVHMKKDLTIIFQKWELIDEFHDVSDTISSCLSDLIENDINEQWGSFVNFCRYIDFQDLYKLMFRLNLLSFDTNAEINAIKSLIAFDCLNELKSLQSSIYSFFVRFKHHEPSKIESLLNIIANKYLIFETNFRWNDVKQNLAQERHRIRCEDEN